MHRIVLVLVFAGVCWGYDFSKCKNQTVDDDIYFFCTERRNATNAEKACEQYDGRLVTITSQEEQDLVENITGMRKDCEKVGGQSTNLTYIGLSDKTTENRWLWSDGTVLRLEDPSVYQNWKTSVDDNDCGEQPNGKTKCSKYQDQDYVAIQICKGKNYGKWFDIDGSKELFFACKCPNATNFWTKFGSRTSKESFRFSGKSNSNSNSGDNTSLSWQKTENKGSQSWYDIERWKSGQRRTNLTAMSDEDYIIKTNYSNKSFPNKDRDRPDVNPQTRSNTNSTLLSEKNLIPTRKPGRSTNGSTTTKKMKIMIDTDNKLTPGHNQSSLTPDYQLKRKLGDQDSTEMPYGPTFQTKQTTAGESEKSNFDSLQTTVAADTDVEGISQTGDKTATTATPSGISIVSETARAQKPESDLNSALNTLKQQIECEMLLIQKESNVQSRRRQQMCGRRVFQPEGNPVQLFDEMVSASVAQLMAKANISEKISVKIPGLHLELTPFSYKQISRIGEASSLTTFGNDSCDSCDFAELDTNHLPKESIAVTGSLSKNILENTGVYNTTLADDEKINQEESAYDKDIFISKATSVISVTLFQHNDNGELVRKSIPASINFDIGADISEAKILLDDPGRIITGVKRKCVFFDKNQKLSSKGCTTLITGSKSVRCECNHTTPFAVMVSMKSFKIPEWEKHFLLATEFIGLFFLALTLSVLLWLRRTLRKDRILTQINLTLALLLMHVSMIVADYVTQLDGFCVFITFLAHFFMIASAMWMLNEGLVLYKKTCSSALNFDINKVKRLLFLIGWLLPGVYVSICLAIGHTQGIYMNTSLGYEKAKNRTDVDLGSIKYEICWLGTRSNMILSAVVPIAVCMCVVLYFLIRVTRVIWRMNMQALDMLPSDVKEKYTATKSTVRAVALLIPVLGVPWIFAFLVNVPGAELVFAAIHGVANGLQGLVLFIVYIVTNKDTRHTAKRQIRKKSIASSSTFSFSVASSVTNFTKSKKVKREDISSTTGSPSLPSLSPTRKKIESRKNKMEREFSSITDSNGHQSPSMKRMYESAEV